MLQRSRGNNLRCSAKFLRGLHVGNRHVGNRHVGNRHVEALGHFSKLFSKDFSKALGHFSRLFPKDFSKALGHFSKALGHFSRLFSKDFSKALGWIVSHLVPRDLVYSQNLEVNQVF